MLISLLQSLARPEEARHVLRGSFDHRVRFHDTELAEQLVCEQGAKVLEGQMNCRRSIRSALHGLVNTTTGCSLGIGTYITHVYILPIGQLGIDVTLPEWACNKLGLVYHLSLASATAEYRR